MPCPLFLFFYSGTCRFSLRRFVMVTDFFFYLRSDPMSFFLLLVLVSVFHFLFQWTFGYLIMFGNALKTHGVWLIDE